MAGSVKSCEWCGESYHRPKKLADQQWQARRFCSKRCAGLRRKVEDTEIVSLYLGGKSSQEVGEAVGLSKTQVVRVLKANGTEIRPAGERIRISHARASVFAKLSKKAKLRQHTEATKQKLRDRVGPKNANWKGGLSVTGGYLQFTASPENGIHAQKLMHRVIAEWIAGRCLEPGEHVHHIDGNKLNNHPSNLAIMSASEHARHHALLNGLGRRNRG